MAATTANPNPFQSASLYVGDLAPDVTEATLFELFNAVGPVASIRVCRDATTRKSLGYAYVNFHNVMDADRALDTMNYTSIKGKQCRIMWSQRAPDLRQSGKGNIFVKKLHKSIDNKTLYDTFSTFGPILSCKVVTDVNTGDSRGYGYVHYLNPDDAQKAIQGVDGMLVADTHVLAEPFVPREERLKRSLWTNVYAKYIPASYDHNALVALFEKETGGKVIKSAFWDRPFGRSACMNFESHAQAVAAVEKMNGYLFGDEADEKTDPARPRKLYVARAQEKFERDTDPLRRRKGRGFRRGAAFNCNLYVKNLHQDVDDQQLRDLFLQYGEITSCRVMTDMKTQKSREFGFVAFAKKDDATKALFEMNGKKVLGRPLYVARAQRKAQRQAFLARQRQRTAQRTIYSNMQQQYQPQPMMPFRPPMQPMHPAQYPGGFPRPFPNMPVPQAFPQRMMPSMGFMPPSHPQQSQMSANMVQQPRPPMGSAAMQPSSVPRPGPPIVPYAQSHQGAAPVPQPSQVSAPKSSAPQVGPPRIGDSVASQMSAPQREIVPLNSKMLGEAQPAERKRLIGERLFPKIQEHEPRLAGKITGMLLEMDNTELLVLLENREALMKKINEALGVLKDHQMRQSEKNMTDSAAHRSGANQGSAAHAQVLMASAGNQ